MARSVIATKQHLPPKFPANAAITTISFAVMDFIVYVGA
jgi:hypothetical protein